MKKAVVDTNVLLESPEILNENYSFILPISVIEEIDGLKKSDVVGWKARRVSHFIDNHENIKFVIKDIYDSIPNGWDENLRDNKIILTAKENKAMLFSNDLNVRIKAKSLNIKTESYNQKTINLNHDGWKEVYMTQQELADFYTNRENVFDLLLGEYLVINSEETKEHIVTYKLDLDGFKDIRYDNISSRTMGLIKPKNIHQRMAFDMLQDKNTTLKVLTGGFGTGKDYLMLSHAFNLLEKKVYEKIIWCRNTVEVKNSKPIGFLKGSMDDKLLPYAMPMADHIGGEDGLKMLISSGKIELQHLGFLRGRDVKNSIIYVSEGENLTKEHIQLIMGRVGEDSMLMLNGDFKQVDDKVFEKNNGLNILIDKLRGHELFGHVKLVYTERSRTASLADILDE